MLLGIFNSSTEKVKHFGFFGGEMVIVNIELSSHLNPPIFKGGVYFIGQWWRVRELSGFWLFYYCVYIS